MNNPEESNPPISPRFTGYIKANLDFWLEKTAELEDETVSTLAPERSNIFRAGQMGLSLPQTSEMAIQLMLQVFSLVEYYGYWQEWIPLLNHAVELTGSAVHLIKLKNQLGFSYRLAGDLNKAASVHEQVARQAEEAGEIGQLARAYFNLATDLRELRDYDNAERYANLAQQAFVESKTTAPRNQAALANLNGLIAHQRGSYETALEYFDLAIPLWQEAKADVYQVRSLLSKGFSLEKLGRYEEALLVYDQATNILDGAGLELDKVSIAINRGNIYYHLGQLDQAVAAYHSADSRALLRSGNIHLHAMIATNLGIVYTEKNELELALAYLEKATRLWRQDGDQVLLANAIGSTADVLAKLGQDDQARSHYQEALELTARFPTDAFAQDISIDFQKGLANL